MAKFFKSPMHLVRACERGSPNRNPMPPPQLPTDTPVSFLTQPVEICLSVPLRKESDSAIFNGVNRVLSQGVHLHEPLIAQKRLNRRLAAVAVLHRDNAVFDLFQMSQRIHLRNDSLASFVTIQTLILAAVFIDRTIRTQDVDRLTHLVLVARPAGIVIGIMRRSYLHCTSAQSLVGQQCISNDRDNSAIGRNHHMLTDKVGVAFVRRMNANSGIAKHRFRTSG